MITIDELKNIGFKETNHEAIELVLVDDCVGSVFDNKLYLGYYNKTIHICHKNNDNYFETSIPTVIESIHQVEELIVLLIGTYKLKKE